MYSNKLANNVGRNIFANEACANIDYKYGPYGDKEEAFKFLKNKLQCLAIGLTVGIYNEDGSIDEYWFKNAINSPDDLIPKNTGGGGGTTTIVVATYNDLPETAPLGTLAFVLDEDLVYVYTSEGWVPMRGGDTLELKVFTEDGIYFTSDIQEINLYARVYLNSKDITDTIDSRYFSWYRQSNNEMKDNYWNDHNKEKKAVTINSLDYNKQTVYTCEIIIP